MSVKPPANAPGLSASDDTPNAVPGDAAPKTIVERVLGKESFRPPNPKRFYKDVAVASVLRDGGPPHFAITLDGRAVKTPKTRPLALPVKFLADAVAAEWAAQGASIDPATMPLTRIANTAIDAVADMMPEVAADIVQFAGSDLVCYRAEGPAALIERQAAAWDPVLEFAKNEFGARFVLSQGVMPVEQPAPSLQRIETAIAGLDAFQLSALHVLTTLTGSALLSVAHLHGGLTADAVWSAAHVDEDWQIEMWGADEDAALRRVQRSREFAAAAGILAMLGTPA